MRLMSALRRLFPPSETIDGYDQAELVDVVFKKTLAYQPKGDWPDVAGASSVLDFGGGCGLHYKQARSQTVRWAVVETPTMAARAQELATERLRFFTSIADAAAWLGGVDVMHSDSALQYAPDPIATLKELCALHARVMIWKRLMLSNRTETDVQKSRLADNGPGKLRGLKDKTVSYNRTTIPESVFISCHTGYSLESSGGGAFRFVR